MEEIKINTQTGSCRVDFSYLPNTCNGWFSCSLGCSFLTGEIFSFTGISGKMYDCLGNVLFGYNPEEEINLRIGLNNSYSYYSGYNVSLRLNEKMIASNYTEIGQNQVGYFDKIVLNNSSGVNFDPSISVYGNEDPAFGYDILFVTDDISMDDGFVDFISGWPSTFTITGSNNLVGQPTGYSTYLNTFDCIIFGHGCNTGNIAGKDFWTGEVLTPKVCMSYYTVEAMGDNTMIPYGYNTSFYDYPLSGGYVNDGQASIATSLKIGTSGGLTHGGFSYGPYMFKTGNVGIYGDYGPPFFVVLSVIGSMCSIYNNSYFWNIPWESGVPFWTGMTDTCRTLIANTILDCLGEL